MASDTSIANQAMRMLKANRITSLTDGSNNANAANDVFAEVREELLRSHAWNFATKRQKLAQLSTVPVFEFDNAYALPSDWIRTVSVHDNDAGAGTVLYREEEIDDQGVILSSAAGTFLYMSTLHELRRTPLIVDCRTKKGYLLMLLGFVVTALVRLILAEAHHG